MRREPENAVEIMRALIGHGACFNIIDTINKPNQYDKYVKVSGKEQQQEQYSSEKKSSKS
jgi:hypothetical protein